MKSAMEPKLPWGLQLAQKAYRKSPHRKKMVACYIEKNNIIISSNSKKTDPLARKFKHKNDRIHAELGVLKHIEDGSKGKLFVYRELANGNIALARPCQYCIQLLLSKGIKTVYYTTNNGIAKETLYHE